MVKWLCAPAKRFVVLFSLCLCGCAAAAFAVPATSAPNAGSVAAIVNTRPISIAAVDAEARKDHAFSTYLTLGRTAPEITNKFYRTALTHLIELQLIEEDGRKKGLLSEKQIAERVNTLLSKQFGSREKMVKALPLLRTTEAAMESQLRQGAVQQLYAEALLPRVTVTEAEIRDVFDRWKKIGRLTGSLAESRPMIEEAIRTERRSQLLRPQIEKLTAAAAIEIFLPQSAPAGKRATPVITRPAASATTPGTEG